MGLPAFPTDLPAYVSPEEYLRLEREEKGGHEYYAGEIRDLKRGGMAHSQLRFNLLHLLFAQLHGKPCRPTGPGRVYIENESSFLYADASVVCGKPEFLEGRPPGTLLNPTLLMKLFRKWILARV